MPKYKTKWDPYSFLLLYIILIPLLAVILLISNAPIREYVMIPIMLTLISLIFLVIFLTTSYKIEGGYFYYRSAVFFGKIKISNIHKLEVGKTLYVGMKPATARFGIIVHYNKYDEVYISPRVNEEVINELLKYNPDIQVIYTKKKV